MNFCSQCLQQVTGMVCPRCNSYKSITPKFANCSPFCLEITNQAFMWREARKKLENYIPTIYGQSGWVLLEEEGVPRSSMENFRKAQGILGKPVSFELLDGGVLVLFKKGGLFCTGFEWGRASEGSVVLAEALFDHANLAKTLEESKKMVESWPATKREVVWGDRDAPHCPFCMVPADYDGGCEFCLAEF